MWVFQELTIEPTLNAIDRRGVTSRANVILLTRRARLTKYRALLHTLPQKSETTVSADDMSFARSRPVTRASGAATPVD